MTGEEPPRGGDAPAGPSTLAAGVDAVDVASRHSSPGGSPIARADGRHRRPTPRETVGGPGLSRYVRVRALEAHRRTLSKTLLYRVLMLLITIAVALFVTGDTVAAVNIGIAANMIKTVTYYAYERLWSHIAWGGAYAQGAASNR